MGTGYSTLLSELRTRVNEASANEWTDPQLLRHISRGEIWESRFLGKIKRSGRFQYVENKTLAASTSDYALSGLTKAFDGLRFVEMELPGGYWQPCPPIDEAQEHLWRTPSSSYVSGTVVPGYILRDETMSFLPVATSARTLKFTYRWVPAAKTSSSDTAETPASYDDVLVLRALYDALADEGTRDDAFEMKYAARLAEIEEIEGSRWNEGQSERVKMVSSSALFG